MSIQKTIEGFLSAKAASAIVLQGKWGIGKTYFWQHRILRHAMGEPWRQRYSYVSLFGISSLSELKTALGVSTAEFDSDALSQWRLKRAATRFWWRAQRWLGDLLQFVPKIGDKAAKIYERASFYVVRNRVICFDDVERRGSALGLGDVLGLISYLVEDRGCRVVVILNNGQLSEADKVIWSDNKEKVFHGELNYSPTLRETIALGLSGDVGEPWYGNAFSNLEILGVSNIRLIQRASRTIRLVVDAAGKDALHLDTLDHISKVLPLLTYSAFGAGDGAPPFEIVLRVTGQSRILSAVAGSSRDASDQEKEFEKSIREYGLYLYTPLDHELVNTIRSGFPDIDKLRAAVHEFQENAESRRLKDVWHDAWRTYHDTLQDNAGEIVAAMRQAWPPVSHMEAAHSLQSLARLLRFLGESELASSYIRAWVEQRRSNGANEFDERVIQSYSPIDDEEILALIATARESLETNISLEDAFNMWMEDDHRIQEDLVSVFAASTSDELEKVLLAVRSERLVAGVRKLAYLQSRPNDPEWAMALSNFQASLKKISDSSELANRRITVWVGRDFLLG
ncbi:hypothetical protein VDP57_12665 [Xanthomonas campestris pv. campestris]|uniref:hypothetical protein n=1 Tax=Xanthomonas campestris TaxID=339 RepID=UPI00226A5290|nr:hypothetical protein [Xanthomonas campestris]MEB1348192.1 hypothetical protein [Xanthomonas campestris pv. campestris]